MGLLLTEVAKKVELDEGIEWEQIIQLVVMKKEEIYNKHFLSDIAVDPVQSDRDCFVFMVYAAMEGAFDEEDDISTWVVESLNEACTKMSEGSCLLETRLGGLEYQSINFACNKRTFYFVGPFFSYKYNISIAATSNSSLRMNFLTNHFENDSHWFFGCCYDMYAQSKTRSGYFDRVLPEELIYSVKSDYIYLVEREGELAGPLQTKLHRIGALRGFYTHKAPEDVIKLKIGAFKERMLAATQRPTAPDTFLKTTSRSIHYISVEETLECNLGPAIKAIGGNPEVIILDLKNVGFIQVLNILVSIKHRRRSSLRAGYLVPEEHYDDSVQPYVWDWIKFDDFRFTYLTNYQKVALDFHEAGNSPVFYKADGDLERLTLGPLFSKYEGSKGFANYTICFSRHK